MTRPVRLTVVGDALLDVDVQGTVERLCPDAPAPVVDVASVAPRPGGAALTAAIAAGAGARVRLVAGVPADAAGEHLLSMLRGMGVETVRVPATGTTPVKKRIRQGSTTLARLDTGRVRLAGQVGAQVAGALRGADAIVVSDYGHGITALAPLRAALARVAQHVPLVWDPHPRGAAPVAQAKAVTPSRAEARSWANRLSPDAEVPEGGLASAVADAATLLRHWDVGALVVTLADAGALAHVGSGTPLLVPAGRRLDGVDSCGAGDAFASALAIAMARDAVLSEAVAQAVAGAGAFLADGGVASFGALAGEMPAEVDPIAACRAAGGRVVATGGCFDLLHPGHIELLRQARALGDCLVVLLNSDESVRSLKGAGRPLQPQDDRRRLLEALADVDAVIVFDERTPERALARLRPDIWVKGGDYAATDLVEEPLLASWGGTTVTVPYLAGRSTSTLVASLELALGLP